MNKIIKLLDNREAEILKRRLGIGYEKQTLEKIGIIFGITRERVRQIEAKALKKIKRSKRMKELHNILEAI